MTREETMAYGEKVRIGGISGEIVGSYISEEEEVFIVDLGGVFCEMGLEAIRKGYPPHEWEVACGGSSSLCGY